MAFGRPTHPGVVAVPPADSPTGDPLKVLYVLTFGIVAYGSWQRWRQKTRPAATGPLARYEPVTAHVAGHRPRHNTVREGSGEDLIEFLCRRTGTLLLRREGTDYWVRPPCATRLETIRLGVDSSNVLFQKPFHVSFPLNPEPAGLFARLMLRNFNLTYATWSMQIGGRCDARLDVCARIPTAGLDADLFSGVCREIINEAEEFRQELHDKFRYGETEPMETPGPQRRGIGTLGQQEHGGVPQRKPWNDLPIIRHSS